MPKRRLAEWLSEMIDAERRERTFIVLLSEDEAAQLEEVAARERVGPDYIAGLLLRRALEQLG